MPLFYQQHINQNTKLAIWKIEENEDFFAGTIPLQREISHPHKRLQHFAGRYLLRYLFPDFPYSEILIADTRKPYLPNENYHFSISHCGDYAAAIVSKDERVGIDIEIPSSKIERIAHKFIGIEQLNINTNILLQQLTVIWSAKETMFKWYGLGKVDFKTMLEANIINVENFGNFEASIKTSINQKLLIINYHFLNPIYLTFTHTN
ncbi:MAG: 4'-phosphopantetheinyl transferase family protein [Chitinophagaceae bacterium]